jgi:RND family efflux transporter MFP subunit
MNAPTRLIAASTTVALILAACSNSAPPAQPTAIPDLPTPAAPTYIVQRGLVARGIEFTARVQPASSESLSFQTDGRIYKLNVKEGDQVKQGAVLAELDLSDLKKQLQQETLRLRTAQSVLSNTVESYSDTLRLAELDLEEAQIRYDAARSRIGGANGLLLNDLKRADRKIADIQNSIRVARENFDQAGADNAQKLLEEAELDRERIVAGLSDADRAARTAELEARTLAANVERARIRIRQLQRTVDPSQLEAIESARLAIETVQARINNGSLIAPFDGEVGQITARVGENVNALAPLMTIAKPGDLELVGSPTEQQLSELSVGQEVTVTFVGAGDAPLPGTIARVPVLGNEANTAGATSRERVVRVQLPAGTPLEPGALARITTFAAKRDNVLWIPPTALRRYRSREFVIVRGADGAERKADVKIGLQSGDRVEIVDGLKEGEIVTAP